MPDRYSLTLGTAVASNTGPFQTTWARVAVPETGTARTVWAVANSITSNARQVRVDVYYQADAPSAGSNTATSILTTPITLVNNNDAVQGSVSEAGARLTAGGQLQLRADAGDTAAAGRIHDLAVTIVVERD